MRVAVVGAGAVGVRAARQLASSEEVTGVTVIHHRRSRLDPVVAALGPRVRGVVVDGTVHPEAFAGVDIAVLATALAHRPLAEQALDAGASVVSTSGSVADVEALLALDAEARERRRWVVAGAAFSPGLSCVLARHAAADLDRVDEVHLARAGTGGPACARHHHHALGAESIDWRDGHWVRRPGGSGRELCWFPDPVGGVDCYRGSLPEALVLQRAFPSARRITARVAATRRDRLTSWLPMLRPPHPEGTLGAVRVEVRGRKGAQVDTVVFGALDRPAVAAAAVAAVAAIWVADGHLARPGAGGLGELLTEPVPFLRELARRGVRCAVFEGAEVGRR